jgi:hypothetical protein
LLALTGIPRAITKARSFSAFPTNRTWTDSPNTDFPQANKEQSMLLQRVMNAGPPPLARSAGTHGEHICRAIAMLGIEWKEIQQRSELKGRKVSSLHQGRIVAQLKKRKKKKKVLHCFTNHGDAATAQSGRWAAHSSGRSLFHPLVPHLKTL